MLCLVITHQPQNTTSISDNNNMDVIMRPIVHHRSKHSTISSSEVHSSGSAILTSEVHANLPDRRSVNQGSDFLKMINEKTMVESFVAIVKILQMQILVNVAVDGTNQIQVSLHLGLEISHYRGQKPSHAQSISLLVIKTDTC